jgi:hypothetical protein
VLLQSKKAQSGGGGTPADFVLFAQHETAAQHFAFPTLARPKIQTGPERDEFPIIVKTRFNLREIETEPQEGGVKELAQLGTRFGRHLESFPFHKNRTSKMVPKQNEKQNTKNLAATSACWNVSDLCHVGHMPTSATLTQNKKHERLQQ